MLLTVFIELYIGDFFKMRIQGEDQTIIFKGKETAVVKSCEKLEASLRSNGIRAQFDGRKEYTAGWKFNHWEMKGVPLRIEIGPRDLEKDQAVMARRDTGNKETAKRKGIVEAVKKQLDEIQSSLLAKAKKHMKAGTVTAETAEQLKKALDSGKWAVVPHCGQAACEEAMAKKFEGGPRVVPSKQPAGGNKCIGCGKKPKYWVYWGRSY